ncbi:MAG: acyl-CoA dehydrogenase [Bacteroidetes bacterium CG_4_10_14_3_um_filter_31_20]|nr:acyl-CoA dehydrogenase [Bacteroidota bacterium]PIY06347.1 MAG: acyl-CoA dehydrogenase [Bacteroidetes bacterium CG_4_10_14_3_um_filter_31_20]
MPIDTSKYIAPDYYMLDELLNDEHKMVRGAARDWVNRQVMPIIEDYFEKAKFPVHLLKELGAIGAFGPFIPTEYGGAGLDYISYGLIMQELERGDSGIRSMASVQSSLVMFPLFKYGSEEQKKKYLPKLASGDIIGCFGLTEPNHGSNPGGMLSHIVDKGSHYLLNGSKMWITNSSVADIAIVWAKDEEGIIRGMIVEKGTKGFSAPETHGKWSLRASVTGELVFDDVIVPKENVLPNVKGLTGPLSCLNSARYGIAWGVIGAAMNCYDTALKYSLERYQFDKPIASFQLQQKKLAEAITEITKAQLLALRLGQLRNEGKVTAGQVSMAKRNNVEMALHIARETRQILGAMGIVNDFPIMRHLMNLESVITYEGTHDMHILITGMDITGISAFK